jgi:hypothetical protein
LLSLILNLNLDWSFFLIQNGADGKVRIYF